MSESTSEYSRTQESLSKSSTELLNATVDIVDALNTAVKCDSDERVLLDSTTNTLLDISAQEPKFSYALPRRISEKDKGAIKPYEHPGLHIGFSLPTNEVLIINVYGGLRKMDPVDLNDNDIKLINSHTNRTEEIISKPTRININLNGVDGKPRFDVWICKNPDLSMFLDSLKLEGKYIDIHPSINNKDTYGYPEINSRLDKSIKELINLIPPKPGQFEERH